MMVCAGWTIEGMMVLCRFPSEDTWKKNRDLRTKASERHDGCEIRTFESMTDRPRCVSEDTWKNLETLRSRVSDNQNGCA